LTFLNSKIDFIILKTVDKQFTLTTKKSLHIIFKCVCWLTRVVVVYNGRETVVVIVRAPMIDDTSASITQGKVLP